MGTDNKNRVNCLKCKYYAVTWNPKFPNACKLLGFKTAGMPSDSAYNATGKACEGFVPKNPQKGNGGNSGADTQAVIVSISNKGERSSNTEIWRGE